MSTEVRKIELVDLVADLASVLQICFVRKCATTVAVTLLLLACAGAQGSPQKIEQIAAAIQAQQFERALDLLRGALQNDPGNAELWTMQGVAHAGQGEKKAALVSFRKALDIAPNNIPALHEAIQLEFDAGDPAAIPLLQRVLRLRPADLTSHGMLAVLQYQQGKCKDAVVHFEKAASLFDQQLPALHAYATCLVRLHRPADAANVFEKTLALEPGDSRERQLLACLQLMAKRPEDAIRTMTPLLSGATREPLTLELASNAYEETHDTEKAVELLRQAILMDPKDVQLYLDFAALSAVHQSFQVGINVVNDGIDLQPNAASLHFARGVLYVQIADYEKAETDFEQAYRLDPNQSLTAAAQGLALVQQNDLDGALSRVQEKLARRPKDPILLYLQADILAQKGVEPGSAEFETAIHSARTAVALGPRLGAARAVLAKLYIEEGKYPEGIEQCRNALEIDPKDQTSLYHLIQALRKSGKTGDIPELLKRLASLRQEAANEEREQYRYKLVEGGTQPK